jgi:hypothetical protein
MGSMARTHSHDAEADFAASELARMMAADARLCYESSGLPAGVSASASREAPSAGWPRADGMVRLLESGGLERPLAVEYKRREEGIHGLLTAMGQAAAYVHKGYSGSAIVIPATYPTLETPAKYVDDVLGYEGGNSAIGVFEYSDPNVSSPTPFAGRIRCVRQMNVLATPTAGQAPARGTQTQWVHMREGSTTRDDFYRFIQVAARLSAGASEPAHDIPSQLRSAVGRIAPGQDPAAYLSNTADDRLLSVAWRTFWFEWVATRDVLTPWVKDGSTYRMPNSFKRIHRDDGRGLSQIWEPRRGSLKHDLCERLNRGAATEGQAWEMFAAGIPMSSGQNKQGIRSRAHSYREDLDSALMQLEWIDSTGRPTDMGWRFASLCEQYGGANSPAAVEYTGATLLQTGNYLAFLHYLHRLSEEAFARDAMSFTVDTGGGYSEFTEDSYWDYLQYIEEELTSNLKVMRKVSGRARPRRRTQFQAELTLLRKYGFIPSELNRRYRLGVGVPINWERVIDALEIDL